MAVDRGCQSIFCRPVHGDGREVPIHIGRVDEEPETGIKGGGQGKQQKVRFMGAMLAPEKESRRQGQGAYEQKYHPGCDVADAAGQG